MTEETKELNVFRVLHGYTGLDDIVSKWEKDNTEGKVLFTYLNLEDNTKPAIDKIAGTVAEMWVDEEGLIVATQLADTPAGAEVARLITGAEKSFTIGPVAYPSASNSYHIESFGGIYFKNK